jgi:hypothetical protein
MPRRLLYLLGLLIALWGIWYFYSASERRSLAVPQQRDFFWTDSLKVDSIAVRYATWTHLARHDGRWVVFTPSGPQPADEPRLSELMRTDNEMVLENLISTRPDKFDKFDVDTSHGVVMKLFAQGKPEAEFVMGKIAADYLHTYVRRLASDSVFMARGNFQRIYNRAPTEWRSTVVFDADSTTIDTVRWIEPDRGETRLIHMPDKSWTVWKPGLDQPQPVDTAIANLKLRRLSPLRADAFPVDGSTDIPKFDSLGLQLIVHATDGRADTLVWQHVAEKETQRTWAIHPGRPYPVYIFFRGSYDRLLGRYDTLVRHDSTATKSPS